MIHALLRLTLLAVNVLDTFKILQPPKPRKGGTEPSARALAARKRGMKGTLCVWIVTACWLSVESISDRTVIYLTPFYNEIKTLCFMFLIFSRSSGAEPILLKVIRPLLRPYIQTIDSMLELLFMVAAFVLDLVSVPTILLRDRWEAFSAAAAADKESEAQEQEARVGVQRPRRVTVFSFWRDVVREEPEAVEDDALPQAGLPAERASDTESDNASLEKPPASKSPRSSTAKPTQTTRNSAGAPAPFVPPVTLLSTVAAPAKPPIDPKRAEATVRQAQAIYDEIDDAQENVRQRMRARKERQVSRPASGTRSVSDGSTTRGRGKPIASSTRGDASGSSGSPTSALHTGVSPSDPAVNVNPFISSPPPQQSFPTKPTQSHPQTIPPYSYVPAPPPEVISHTQRAAEPPSSPEIQGPLPLSPFATIPSTSQTPASARFPSQRAPSSAQDPLAGIDIDAYFSTIGSPRGQRAVPDPTHNAPARGILGRPRPQHLDSEKLANHPATSVELLKPETPSETPPSPPSQYLGRPSHNTPTRPQIPGSAPAKTPLAPGGFGWHDNSQRTEANDDDEEDEAEDEDGDDDKDSLGPNDSISVRGLRPAGESRDPALPPDSRPSTIFEFDQLKKQVEDEEAAEIRAYAQALATLGITNGNGALGLTAAHPDNSGGANAALRMSVNLPGHFPMSPGFQPKEITPLPQAEQKVQAAQPRPIPREHPAPTRPQDNLNVPHAEPSRRSQEVQQHQRNPTPTRPQDNLNVPPVEPSRRSQEVPQHQRNPAPTRPQDTLNIPPVEPSRRSQEVQQHQRNPSGTEPHAKEPKKAAGEGQSGNMPQPFIPPSIVSNTGTVKPPPPASTIVRNRMESRPPTVEARVPPTVQANTRPVQAKPEAPPQPAPKPQPRPNSSASQRQRSGQPPTSFNYQRHGSGPDSIQAMTEQFVETISPPAVSTSLPRSYERTAGMRSQTPVTANMPDPVGPSRYQPPPTAPAVPMKMPQPQPQHQRIRSEAPTRTGPAVTTRRVGSTGSNSPSVSSSSEFTPQGRVTRAKAPIVAQKRSSEHLDERGEGTSSRTRNPAGTASDENKKRRVAPPVPQASIRTRSSTQHLPREGARSASGSSASEVVVHTRTRSAAEGMPSSSNRVVAQQAEISQPRRPRPRGAQ